ncbi:unnamed protein product, partial [marine sediment metagenome]
NWEITKIEPSPLCILLIYVSEDLKIRVGQLGEVSFKK